MIHGDQVTANFRPASSPTQGIHPVNIFLWLLSNRK
jgi:hypothetical protein